MVFLRRDPGVASKEPNGLRPSLWERQYFAAPFFFCRPALASALLLVTTVAAHADAVRVKKADVFVVCPTFKALPQVVGSLTVRALSAISSAQVKAIVPGCVVTADSALLANKLVLHPTSCPAQARLRDLRRVTPSPSSRWGRNRFLWFTPTRSLASRMRRRTEHQRRDCRGGYAVFDDGKWCCAALAEWPVRFAWRSRVQAGSAVKKGKPRDLSGTDGRSTVGPRWRGAGAPRSFAVT